MQHDDKWRGRRVAWVRPLDQEAPSIKWPYGKSEVQKSQRKRLRTVREDEQDHQKPKCSTRLNPTWTQNHQKGYVNN